MMNAYEQTVYNSIKAIYPNFNIVRFGVYAGIGYAVVQSTSGACNGYVAIPREGHAWSALSDHELRDIADESLDVHGGITFARNGWIGFDTLHGHDVWNGIRTSDDDILWTVDMVDIETRYLAYQVAAFTTTQKGF